MELGASAPLVSPVLVGRDDLLELADRRLSAVRSGAGHLLLLAGEAGIGKTRLLAAMERRATLGKMASMEAAAFPRDLEVAGGLLLDLARSLEASPRAEIGRRIRARLEDANTHRRQGDAHRHRRLLAVDLADLLASLADDSPCVLSLEDLHWADDLALEVLGQLARRIRGLPLLVIGTYRSDELFPRVPMREWRTRLLTQRLAEEARLSRLSPEQTATMARTLLPGGSPLAHEFLADLHRRSDGIPLHVEELLGAMAIGARDRNEPLVPDTLADAIAARADQLSRRARRVARGAAVIGRSFDAGLLASIVGEEGDVLDRALRELQERFFIVPGRRSGSYDFRHALIRDALYAEVGPRARSRMHERAARLLAERDGGDAAVAAHFEQAGVDDEAHRWSRRAAERASRLSAHREAAELYRRALRTLPRDPDPVDEAGVLLAFATEAAASDDNQAAADAYDRARRILRDNGHITRAAGIVPPLAAARHLLGASLDERVLLLRQGLEELEHAPASDDALRARLLAGLSAAYMLDRRLDESIEHGEAARSLAVSADDAGAALNASVTLGSDFVFAGRMDDGWALLEDAVAGAREAALEAEAARAYRMIGSSASVLVEYARAEHWLREGIEYAERVELWNHRHYMAAHLAHVAWATGDWARAESLAEDALADGRGGITTRITALHVLGFVAMGRGDAALSERLLGEAREAGERMGELQRLSPAIWGLAETALLAGRPEEAVDLCEAGRRASAAVADAAYLFPYTVTGTRALLQLQRPLDAERWLDEVRPLLVRRSIPGTLHAIDHAEGLLLMAGGSTRAARRRLAQARAGWQGARRRWEELWATIDLARAEQRSRRRLPSLSALDEAAALAERLGAKPLLARAEEIGRGLRARITGEEAWAPLTAREYDVASLIALGRTNAEIAAELGIAPKTVSAHVEHILDRLGATRRAEIAAWVGARSSTPAAGERRH